eukprot:CAMPEP_0119521458 /NCGR_PEP_ID=MMETSP1344-20130328/37154_1 /TAXON_ID=236787 /ORGANISM="Florenciella parvula, Strain CCMP2471" /LENGTH=32 /DNA_ID= /DNA_START= /DNA_END= /DNA_ORIENTATION=
MTRRKNAAPPNGEELGDDLGEVTLEARWPTVG